MPEYRLVGFISDLDGKQSQLFHRRSCPSVWRRPVCCRGKAVDRRPHLRKISPSALRFVEPIPDEEQVAVQPGEVVWLAGRTFVSELAAITRTPEVASRSCVVRWTLEPDSRLGFAWSVGTRVQLMRLIAEPTTDITAMLHRALFDRQELSHGDAESYFLVFPRSSSGTRWSIWSPALCTTKRDTTTSG